MIARTSLSVALLMAFGLAAAGGAGQSDRQRKATPKTVVAKSIDTKVESRIEARETINDVVAAAVIGAVTGQFDGSVVEVRLDAVDATPVGVRDSTVVGRGRLQLDGDGEWIPFQFQALYDTLQATAAFPQLVIGGEAAHEIALDSTMARSLQARVEAGVESEFEQQSARFALKELRASEESGRYQRVSGVGVADFGAEGSTPAQVNALFDRKSGKWLRVSYELGPAANWSSDRQVAGL